MQRKPTSKGPRDKQSEDGSTGNEGLSRRKMMAAGAATWVTASVAGCSGNGGETTTETTTAGEPQPANYVVTDEMATAAAFGVSFASSCSPTRLFAPGMKAIWEINVYDAESGENLGPDAVDSVTVNVDGAGELEAAWMGDEEEHPADMWEATWDVPSDAETGEWTYTIEVTSSNEADVLSVGRATGSFTVQADEMPDFYVSTETYWNGHPAPEGTAGFVGTCAPEREFFTTMDPTFYVQIYETESGKIVGAEAEKNSEVDTVSDYNIASVTVRFPETDEFEDLEMEWLNGAGDENTAPHWEATLTSPEELPVGTHPYEIDIVGTDADVEKEDVKIVGAASDAFNVIEQA